MAWCRALSDCGMVGRIDDELRERIIEILLAAAGRDAPRLTEVIALICKAPADLDRGARLCAWFGVPEGESMRLVAVLAFDAPLTVVIDNLGEPRTVVGSDHST